MGYTHYWKLKPSSNISAWVATLPLIVQDARLIISHSPCAIAGPNGEGEPTLSVEKGIMLNGGDGEDHESFVLTDTLSRFNYCKTAMKGYDAVVTAILLRAVFRAGDCIEVSSDGLWDEWVEGRELVESIWPDELVARPSEIRDDMYDGTGL